MTVASVATGAGGMDEGFIRAGFTPLWFSDIDATANAVSRFHHPDVPNIGDMTSIVDQSPARPDVFIGGTPCQDFSVAGLRAGIQGKRGNLTLAFIEIADHLDPEWVVWENVLGVLSSTDNAFGSLLGGLVGADSAIPPLRGDDGWGNSGVVAGPKRVVGFRVLDAQYFEVAQRRRRVFVVGHSLTFGRSVGLSELQNRDRVLRLVTQVLFESEGLRRDTPPIREKRTRIAASLTAGSHPCSNSPGRRREDDLNLATYEIANTLKGSAGERGWQIEDGSPLIPSTASLTCGNRGVSPDQACAGMVVPVLSYALMGKPNDSQDPTSQTYCIQHAQIGRKDESGPQGKGYQEDVAYTLDTTGTDALAFGWNKSASQTMRVDNDATESLQASESSNPAIQSGTQVRRLTPVECERLMGWPDDFTRYKLTAKGVETVADGHRYQLCGNGVVTPVAEWIARRIAGAAA